jgi:hypothetical protein
MRGFLPSNPSYDLPESLTHRDFARLAVLLAAATALPFYNESTLAQDVKAITSIRRTPLSSTPTRTRSAPVPKPSKPSTRSHSSPARCLVHETFAYACIMLA